MPQCLVQEYLRLRNVVRDALLEVAYPYNPLLVYVDGTEVVARQGMRFQRVMGQMGQRTRLGLVDKSPEMAGDKPDISLGVFGNVAYSVELLGVDGQFYFFPLCLHVLFVEEQAVLEGINPNPVVTVDKHAGDVLFQKPLVLGRDGNLLRKRGVDVREVQFSAVVDGVYVLVGHKQLGDGVFCQRIDFGHLLLVVVEVYLAVVVGPQIFLLAVRTHFENSAGCDVELLEYLLAVPVEFPRLIVVYGVSVVG